MRKRGIVTIIIFIILLALGVFFAFYLNQKEKQRIVEAQIYDLTDTTRFCKSIGRTNSYLIFKVVDESGNKLENVSFEIYEKHHILLDTSNTNANGKAGFSGMEDDTYYVRVVNTPEGYEIPNVEYVMTPNQKKNCFKKSIVIKKGEKTKISEYVNENIEAFERQNAPNDVESPGAVTRYAIFLDDEFEGLAVRIKFKNAFNDESKYYPLRREVFLEIDNAEIVSYTVTPSGDREDYANILDLNENEVVDFDGKASFYVATLSYITEGNLDFTITFRKDNKKYKVEFAQTYSLIRSEDFGRFILHTLNEEQTAVEGENGVYKLYDENDNIINFPEYSASGATINYKAIKPAWYRVDRVIKDKVVESKTFLVENNFITNIWM